MWRLLVQYDLMKAFLCFSSKANRLPEKNVVRERLTVRSVYFVRLCVHASVSFCISHCKPNLLGVLHHCLSKNVFVMVVTRNFRIDCCLLGLECLWPESSYQILMCQIKNRFFLLPVKAVCLNFIRQSWQIQFKHSVCTDKCIHASFQILGQCCAGVPFISPLIMPLLHDWQLLHTIIVCQWWQLISLKRERLGIKQTQGTLTFVALN